MDYHQMMEWADSLYAAAMACDREEKDAEHFLLTWHAELIQVFMKQKEA
jgi:hypothetical protein